VSADRITKQVTLRASPRRVWKALADSQEFGQWFGIRFTGPFVPGATVRGVITGTTADPEIAKAMAPMVGIAYSITVERMEPEKLFSYRWHPHSLDKTVDYSKEPTTLVVFELQAVPEGTLLTVTESGFDQIPAHRRKSAFEANEGGWGVQVVLIGKHLERNP
jgi:uncharacterized protein YndB with AHSA1/START domain